MVQVYDLLGNPTGEKEKATSPNDIIVVRKADVVFKVICLYSVVSKIK